MTDKNRGIEGHALLNIYLSCVAGNCYIFSRSAVSIKDRRAVIIPDNVVVVSHRVPEQFRQRKVTGIIVKAVFKYDAVHRISG